MKTLLALLALTLGISASTAQAQKPDVATVVVRNDAPVAATVYFVDRGSKVRLGTVSAASERRFPIAITGAPARFYVASSKGNVTTNEIQEVRAADRLVVTVDPTVALSWVTR